MKTNDDPFVTLDAAELGSVAGGATRVTSRSGSNDQLTQMLAQITSSLQSLGKSNQSDPSQMLMMMMMMGGLGGGGGGAVAAPVAAPSSYPQSAPVINVSGDGGGGFGAGNGSGGGRKGW